MVLSLSLLFSQMLIIDIDIFYLADSQLSRLFTQVPMSVDNSGTTVPECTFKIGATVTSSMHDRNCTCLSYFLGNKAELLKMKNEYVQLRSGKDGEFTSNEGMKDDESVVETSEREIEEIQETKKNQQEQTEGKKEKGEKPVQNKVNHLRVEKKKKKKIIANQQTKQEEQQKMKKKNKKSKKCYDFKKKKRKRRRTNRGKRRRGS